MTSRIFAKLIFAVVCVLVVALVSVDVLATRVAESTYVDSLRRKLAAEARLLALLGVPRDRVPALAHSGEARVTVIQPDGRVASDSEANPDRMENHKGRPEVQAALNGREGSSIRRSPTIGEPYLYVAVPFSGGAIRLAVPLVEVQAQVREIRKRMLFSTALAFLPAIIVAAFFARRVSAKLAAIIVYAGELAKGNFSARLGESKDELGLLSGKLNETSSKLQQAVEALEHEHNELEKVERIRKDFIINVSHELRTPLASIQGYTETLLDGALDDPEHNVRFLSIIRQNAERLARLVADLMTLSNLELKARKLAFGCHEAAGLLHDAMDLMVPIAAKKNIHIAIENSGGDAQVYCDREATNQVLSNLIDNAVKYTPEGGSVTIGTRPLDGECEFHVRDTGIGVPKDEIPRLFERFYRVDKARSRELGGTGLGLSIVKHLVRAQGGEVRVESEPGAGSTFFFTLPNTRPPGLPGTLQKDLTEL